MIEYRQLIYYANIAKSRIRMLTNIKYSLSTIQYKFINGNIELLEYFRYLIIDVMALMTNNVERVAII